MFLQVNLNKAQNNQLVDGVLETPGRLSTVAFHTLTKETFSTLSDDSLYNSGSHYDHAAIPCTNLPISLLAEGVKEFCDLPPSVCLFLHLSPTPCLSVSLRVNHSIKIPACCRMEQSRRARGRHISSMTTNDR